MQRVRHILLTVHLHWSCGRYFKFSKSAIVVEADKTCLWGLRLRNSVPETGLHNRATHPENDDYLVLWSRLMFSLHRSLCLAYINTTPKCSISGENQWWRFSLKPRDLRRSRRQSLTKPFAPFAKKSTTSRKDCRVCMWFVCAASKRS